MSLTDGSGLSAADIMARNMLGGNCNTPKDALDLLFRSGKINQEQYNTFARML